MTASCVRCGRPTDATVCRPEAQTLAAELLTAAGHAEDAEAVITRQVRYGNSGPRTGEERPIPSNLAASRRLAAAAHTTETWLTRIQATPEPWRVMTGPLCPPRRPGDEPRRGNRCAHTSCAAIRDRTPPSALAEGLQLLARHTDDLRRRPDAADGFTALERTCQDLAHLVDRPADNRHLVGVCNCGKILYAPWDWTVIQCRDRTCGAVWSLADGQDILMRHLDDKLMTGGEASRLAAYLDTSRTQDNIRKLIDRWAGRSLLLAHGYVMREPTEAELKDDPNAGPVAVPTYRFGDIREQLAQTPRRNREGAAA